MGGDPDLDNTIGEADVVRRAFDSLPLFIVAFAGPEHHYVAANAATRTAFPRCDWEFRARTFPEFEDQNLIEILNRVYRTGEIQQGREWRFQFDFDGSGHDAGGLRRYRRQPTRGRRRKHRRHSGDADRCDRSGAGAPRRGSARGRTVRAVRAGTGSRNSRPTCPTVADAAVLAGADMQPNIWWPPRTPAPAVTGSRRCPEMMGMSSWSSATFVGHGVEAAAVMAQLRTAIRMSLLAGNDIHESLTAVDQFSKFVPGSKAATLCIAAWTPARGFRILHCGTSSPTVDQCGRPTLSRADRRGDRWAADRLPDPHRNRGCG